MRFFILHKSRGKLIGARSIAFAFDTFEGRDNFVYIFIIDEFSDSLKVSAATADEFDVADLIVNDIEKYLTRTSALGTVGVHFFLLYSTRLS